MCTYVLTHTHFRQVLVTRRDGCVLLFNETIEETKLPDDSCYDNRVNGTQLPVRSVFKTPEKLPILCSTIVHYPGENRKSVWCGTKHEILLVFDVYPSQIQYCRKKYNRSRYDNLEEDCVASITVVEEECDGHVTSYVWALSRPGNVFYCWNTSNEQLLTTVSIDQFTTNEGKCNILTIFFSLTHLHTHTHTHTHAYIFSVLPPCYGVSAPTSSHNGTDCTTQCQSNRDSLFSDTRRSCQEHLSDLVHWWTNLTSSLAT